MLLKSKPFLLYVRMRYFLTKNRPFAHQPSTKAHFSRVLELLQNYNWQSGSLLSE